jgi:hypothetical protein
LGGAIVNRNLIHRATDYFGIAYYGFLALYSLYELLFGGEYLSTIVVSPLLYTLLTLGLVWLSLIPFYLFVGLRRNDSDLFIGRVLIHLSVGGVLIAGAIIMANEYMTSEEASLFVFARETWLFSAIAVVDILLRPWFFKTSDDEGEDLVKRLEGITSSFSSGNIAAVILIFGIMYIKGAPQICGNVCMLTLMYILPFTIILESLNIQLAKRYPSAAKAGSLNFPIKQIYRHRASEYPHVLWPSWASILFSLPISLSAYLLLFLLTLLFPFKRLFIIVFAINYGLLAVIRLRDIHTLGKPGAEVTV